MFPQVEVTKESNPIKFTLGVATTAELRIRCSGKGVQISQGSRTNRLDTDSGFADRTAPFEIIFPVGSTEEEVTVTPFAMGATDISFVTVGTTKDSYRSLEDDVRSVNGLLSMCTWLFPCPLTVALAATPGAPTVWSVFGISEGQMPVGTNFIDVSVIAGGPKVRFASTELWTTAGSTFESCGAVQIIVGTGNDQVRIPVSTRGLLIDTTKDFEISMPDFSRCGSNAISQIFTQQLVVASSLPNTFLQAIGSVFPDWLDLSVEQGVGSQASSAFDFEISVLLGPAARAADPSCASLPVKDNVRYATIVWGKPARVSVDSQNSDVSGGTNFCFLIDVSEDPGSVVMVGIPQAAWNQIQGLQFKTDLEDAGWELGKTDLAFCFPACFDIQSPITYWNGDEFFEYKVKPANFW